MSLNVGYYWLKFAEKKLNRFCDVSLWKNYGASALGKLASAYIKMSDIISVIQNTVVLLTWHDFTASSLLA